MTRLEMVKRLINEGLSTKTLVNFSDNQLRSLCNRMLNEQPVQTKNERVTSIDTSTPEGKKAAEGFLNDPKSLKGKFEVREGKKKPTEKQLSVLDKNKNKKIDKQDFELLRKGKKQDTNESLMGIGYAVIADKLKEKLGKNPTHDEINRELEKLRKELEKSYKKDTSKKSDVKEGMFGGLFGGSKPKKINTIEYDGYEIDVWDIGGEKMYGHPREMGEKPSYVSHLLIYDNLGRLKKAINSINKEKRGDDTGIEDWQSGDEGMDAGAGTAVPSFFPNPVKKIKNPDFKGFSIDESKSQKLSRKTKLEMTLKKLKEHNEISEWVNNLAESNYHPFTSKGEIMELLRKKLNEEETMIAMPKKAKIGHNGIPEFMTYDAIMSDTTTTPVIAPKPGTKDSPMSPRPNINPAPSAGIKGEYSENKTTIKTSPKPGTKDNPLNPKPNINTSPSARKRK